jgi:hypothetical protein
MEFLLRGFDQSDSVRRFRFESVDARHTRATIVVVADLTLARQYGIQVQNLPLLCRELLMRSDPSSLAAGLLALTAADMAALQTAAKAKVEEKKPRRVRPVVSSNTGKAWRAPLTLAPA